MNTTTTLAAALTALAFVTVSCGEKKTTETTETKKTAVPHDHDGDGIPDHGPGAHKEPVPHDHDGDGIPDHGPGAHGENDGHNHDDHSGHSHAKKVAGPNGGRVLTDVEPHAEFFVTSDKKIQITFLSDDNQPAALATQSVSVVMGKRSAPTKISLVPSADQASLVSETTIPEGNNIDTYVTFKMTADSKPVRSSFILNLSDCPSCDYLEYACTCDHGHSH